VKGISLKGGRNVARFEIKAVSELSKGEWAQVNGMWAEVLECSTELNGWTRIRLEGWQLPETTMHKTVEVPWSLTKPADVA
jgi:hypothetical protein